MHISPKRPAFTTLASDMILLVFSELRPRDIISLRQTCKLLFDLTKLRTVWMTALRSIMLKHFIPEATFPVRTMSLSLLEHVALAPERLLSLLEKYDGNSIRPMTIRVLAPRLSKAEKDKYSILDNDGLYDSCLESAGRYLATLTSYESFTLITLWDLGLCGSDAIKPLARYKEISPLKLYLDALYAGPLTSDTFIIVSTHESSLLSPLSVFVHRVSTSNGFEISFLAKLEVSVAPPFTIPRISQIPDSSRLVVQYDDDEETRHIWIWDFHSNTVAALIPSDYAFPGRDMSLYYNNCIMVAAQSEGCIRVYNMPPLLPRDSVNVSTEQKPALNIAAPWKTSDSFFVGLDIAHHPTTYFLGITPTQVVFFEVTDNNPCQGSEKLPNKLPMTIGNMDVTDPTLWSQNPHLLTLRRCEGYLFLSGYSSMQPGSGELLLFAININQILSGNATLKKAIFSNPLSRQDTKGRQFSPLLGRMCLHARQRTADFRTTQSVYVIDYLASPE